MTNIQKKTLNHISEILESFDTFPVYTALIDTMTSVGIDNETRNKISDAHRVAISEQRGKVSVAKEWIDALVSDAE